MILINQLLLTLNAYYKIDQYSQTVRIVLIFLLFIFLIILLLFIFTLLVLVLHQISASITKKYRIHFQEMLINYTLDTSAPLPICTRFNKVHLRNTILDLVQLTKGHEKNVLLEVYKINGFWNEDLKKLQSYRWYKRLGALIRLDQWQLCLGSSHLEHLLLDKNMQIRQIATKNFSRTSLPREAQFLVEVLLKPGFHHSTIYECLHRMFQNHSEFIKNILDDKTKMKLWPLILKVIGNMRVIDATPKLIEFIYNTEDPTSKEKAIVALGKIGDPRGIMVLKDALNSKSAGERLEAMQSLYNIDHTQFLTYQKILENDADPIIRNWINYYARLTS